MLRLISWCDGPPDVVNEHFSAISRISQSSDGRHRHHL